MCVLTNAFARHGSPPLSFSSTSPPFLLRCPHHLSQTSHTYYSFHSFVYENSVHRPCSINILTYLLLNTTQSPIENHFAPPRDGLGIFLKGVLCVQILGQHSAASVVSTLPTHHYLKKRLVPTPQASIPLMHMELYRILAQKYEAHFWALDRSLRATTTPGHVVLLPRHRQYLLVGPK